MLMFMYTTQKPKQKGSENMKFYREKGTGLILREDDALRLCGSTGLFNQYELVRGDDLTRAIIDDVIATHGPTDSYKYMLLDRLRGDCGYYLDGGGRNTKYLWGGSVRAHLDAMRALYNSFPKDSRPEWLTMNQINEYAAAMEREPTEQAESSPAVGTH